MKKINKLIKKITKEGNKTEIDYAGHVNTVCARGQFVKYLLLNY